MSAVNWVSVLCYQAVAMLLAGGCALLWDRAGQAGAEGSLWLMVMMFTPTLAALLVQAWRPKDTLKVTLGLPLGMNRWMGMALLLPLIMVGGSVGIILLLPGTALDATGAGLIQTMKGQLSAEDIEKMQTQLQSIGPWLVPAAVGQGLLAGATFNAVFAMGEEMGWRGFLYRHLRPLGFWKSAALTGLFWGTWHAPVVAFGYNFPQHPMAGVGIMTLWGVAAGPLFHWVRERSGTVVGPAIAHGVFNGLAGIPLMLVVGGVDIWTSPVGLAAVVSALLIWPLVWLLRHSFPAPAEPPPLSAQETPAAQD